MRRCFLLTTLLSISVAFTASQSGAADGDWPGYRGGDGSGHTQESGLPVKWTEKDVVWRTELSGIGQSSPCIWGEQIFVTTAAKNDDGKVERFVQCIERGNGKVIWKQLASTGVGESLHSMNTWATPTCATDGKRVVAFFGPGGIHCYGMDGDKIWSKDLGEFPGGWGIAASPIILGNLVIQNCDATGPSYLIALNKETGKQVWRTDRKALPKGGWSTPILIDTGKRKELVLNGEFGAQGYNPETGADYWYCKSFNGRGSPIPAWGQGLLYVVNGKPGDIYAVRPGGQGNVTASHMAWHTKRGGDRDLSSPIVVGDYVFVVSMKGIATTYDAKSGKELWQKRLGGNFSGPPIAANGLIYLQDEAGTTAVVRPGKDLDVVAKNPINATDDEIFRASPSPSRGQIFVRSNRALYCIGKRATVAGL
jgi:outer membrane protein assembly factor BamB